MLNTKSRVGFGSLALLLVLAGCKNPMPPNPMPPSPRPPTSSTPTMPSPSPPSTPAPPSRPSPGPSMPDPGVPSPPQTPPQVSLPSPDLPGPPGQQGQPGEKSDQKQRKGQPGSPDGRPDGDSSSDPMEERAEERQQAGEDLQKAADEVAGTGGDEPYDPMIQSTPEKPGEDGLIGDAGEEARDDDPMLAENDRSGDPNAAEGDPVSEEVAEIMAEVAEALRKAGIEVSEAATEEDLRAAEEALAQAQVAIIVAEEGLDELREAGQDVSRENDALAGAERSIIVASRVVLASSEALPGLPGGQEQPPDELDVALEDSLIIFDGQMEEVRRAGGGGGPAPEGPTVASLPTRMPENENAETATILSEAPDELPAAEEIQIAAANVPSDVGDGQDDDIIARQLREAAIAEADPALQEKLWEEYRRYKQGTR